MTNNRNDAYIFGPDQLNIMAMLLYQFEALDNIPGVLKINIEEYPDHYSSYYELGKFYSDIEKKYDLAEEYLQKALELSDDDSKKEIKNKIDQVETQKNNESGKIYRRDYSW